MATTTAPMTEGRARIAAAQRRRWASYRAAKRRAWECLGAFEVLIRDRAATDPELDPDADLGVLAFRWDVEDRGGPDEAAWLLQRVYPPGA